MVLTTSRFRSGFALSALSPEQVGIGTKLEWPIYDADATLLLEAGEVILTERERDSIFAWCRPHWYAPGADAHHGSARPLFALHFGGLELVDYASGTQFRMGHTVQIQPSPARGGAGATVRVLGASPNGMLFVAMPTVDGIAWNMQLGEVLQLRAFSGTDIFRFACTLESACQVPTPYLILSPPAQIQKMPIRGALRVRTKILARLSAPRAPEPAMSVLTLINNLSATGASVLSSELSLPVGDAVELTFQVRASGVATAVTVLASIRRASQEIDETSHYTLGLEFEKLDITQQLAINCLVCQQFIVDPRSVV